MIPRRICRPSPELAPNNGVSFFIHHSDSGVGVFSAAQAKRAVNILAISDKVEGLIYSPAIRKRFAHIDLVISCGDLPYYYLDYVISMLNVPLYYVHGNHEGTEEHSTGGTRTQVWGATDLDGQVVNSGGLLLGGFEGSRRYNRGPHQYSENEMWLKIFGMVPKLMWNKARFGRYLDILVTHAPPRHIHDQPDVCHQGFTPFRWFLKTFRPRYHLHGHIHVYNNQTITTTRFHDTTVLNVYSYRELPINVTLDASESTVAVDEKERTSYGIGTTDTSRF